MIELLIMIDLNLNIMIQEIKSSLQDPLAKITKTVQTFMAQTEIPTIKTETEVDLHLIKIEDHFTKTITENNFQTDPKKKNSHLMLSKLDPKKIPKLLSREKSRGTNPKLQFRDTKFHGYYSDDEREESTLN